MDIKKHLPTREQLREVKSLRFLGDVIFEPNLWHFNRHSISYAVLIGSICCFLPIPFQMVPCLFMCMWLRCNVPLAIAIVWASNPITMPPMMYFAYRVGRFLLGMEDGSEPVNISVEWFTSQLAIIWQPLILGCLVCGIAMGVMGFAGVRLYYRWRIYRYVTRKRSTRIGG